MEENFRKTYPRDVLMNLLSIGALYTSITTFLRLIFHYINLALPDPLNPYYGTDNSVRWSLALIIVVFPVYLYTVRFLNRDLKANIEKNDLKIRRWLIYFTLFASAVLIIGDTVALIYNFLQGELTWRFIFKVLSILVVAVAVFRYYLYDLRKPAGEFSSRAKIFIQIAIAMVAACAVCGLIIAGSPFKQRLVNFDSRKISDLQILQNQIVNYWTQKEKLPQSLDELKDSISGFAPPQDPQIKESYGYETTELLSFKLCARFNLESKESDSGTLIVYSEPMPMPMPIKPYGAPENNWSHPKGKHCFERAIDPDLYKPAKKD